jgi:hypothetical protein
MQHHSSAGQAIDVGYCNIDVNVGSTPLGSAYALLSPRRVAKSLVLPLLQSWTISRGSRLKKSTDRSRKKPVCRSRSYRLRMMYFGSIGSNSEQSKRTLVKEFAFKADSFQSGNRRIGIEAIC